MTSERHYSKFERTRIISARALQIAQGSPILVDPPKKDFNPIDIAKMEWKAGMIPIDVKRPVKEKKD